MIVHTPVRTMFGREGMMKEMCHTGPNQDPHTPFGPRQDLPYPYMDSGNPLKLAFRVGLGLRSISLYGIRAGCPTLGVSFGYHFVLVQWDHYTPPPFFRHSSRLENHIKSVRFWVFDCSHSTGVERDGIAIQLSMDMEEIPVDGGFLENRYPNTSWWRSEFAEKLGSVSLDGKQEIMRNRELTEREYDRLSSQIASQIFWKTGTLSEPIPNGFYSVVPIREGVDVLLEEGGNEKKAQGMECYSSLFNEKRLKECFEDIPTLDELHALELEGLGADVILVDAKKDKKLSMLKQLIVTLVKGLNSNPAAMIKKIAGLVADVYKRPNSELSHAKASLEEASQISENKGVQLLGQIKNSSSRPRAILFKLLADAVGLESQLVVGLPAEAASECAESYKHMSILVVLNSVELFVDLIRFPGQLIPRTTKSIYLTHIAAGESDSAENDSCDSPLEPNSPLYEFSERNDTDSSEKDDILQYQRRFESSSNAAGSSLRNMMLRSHTSIDRKLRYFLAHTESHDLTFESPEHPSFRAHVRSMLGGDNKTSRGYSDDVSTSRGGVRIAYVALTANATLASMDDHEMAELLRTGNSSKIDSKYNANQMFDECPQWFKSEVLVELHSIPNTTTTETVIVNSHLNSRLRGELGLPEEGRAPDHLSKRGSQDSD
ncbi:putative F-box protein ORE9-like [Capsicum annuum]|nr:putative F-box protein ORE9-like [Capsicum annuum]KAF3676059.1 putative F-box protein ORE9-like [Capsicum annuum]